MSVPGGWAPPSSPLPPAGRWVLAPWGPRAAAALIDLLVVAVLAAAVAVPLAVVALSDARVGVLEALGLGLLGLVLMAVATLGYAPVWMRATDGQTLGKQLLGLRVVRVDGRRVTFGHAVLREVVVKGLLVGAAGGATLGLGWLLDAAWPLWDEEHRALHDLPVRTRVVRA